jgi:hypothetical protein
VRPTLARACDALILFGPPGSGKSFLGDHLARKGIAEFRELEPTQRKRFGSGAAFQERFPERWETEIAPRHRFDLVVDGNDPVSAARSIRSFLEES